MTLPRTSNVEFIHYEEPNFASIKGGGVLPYRDPIDSDIVRLFVWSERLATKSKPSSQTQFTVPLELVTTWRGLNAFEVELDLLFDMIQQDPSKKPAADRPDTDPFTVVRYAKEFRRTFVNGCTAEKKGQDVSLKFWGKRFRAEEKGKVVITTLLDVEVLISLAVARDLAGKLKEWRSRNDPYPPRPLSRVS